MCAHEEVNWIMPGVNSKRKVSGYEQKIENRNKETLCNYYECFNIAIVILKKKFKMTLVK